MNEYDWMSEENSERSLEGVSDEARKEQYNKAIEFARMYQVFETDERGKALYEHWRKTILERPTPTESSLQRYAADNAMREFVINIGRQIALAKEQPL
jgi:hypothetical protein